MLDRFLYTDDRKTTILIRIVVGIVFLSKGLLKFIFPALRGAGCFESIGIPSPMILGYFVGTFEVLYELFILIGLFTRFAAFLLIVIMIVAIITTKFKILVEQVLWEMMHAARTDFSMFPGSIFLLIRGGGKWSLDRLFWRLRINI
jgi:putative oxidoreductase